jgi:5'-methylthioadenosine phosphorylase
MEKVSIAIIGGSGLYNMAGISDKSSVSMFTPFGTPSADIGIGTLRGKRVAFLPRHGTGHVLSPSTIPYRANIHALKQLGVKFIIAVSACGSLKEEYAPSHIVIPDQLVDFTKGLRQRTFFDNGFVAHVGVADPFCPHLSQICYDAVAKTGGTVHHGGAYVTIEGPRFSTKAESNIYRQWGCSIIGMTTSPEAFLAREAEMSYAVMAHITDYDVWHETESHVSVDMVMKTFEHNLRVAQEAVANAIEAIDENADYPAHHALENAFITPASGLTSELHAQLAPIIGRYFPA